MDKLLTPSTLAEYAGYSVAGLAQMRYMGTGPKFIKMGRQVRYRLSDVEAWLDQQTRQSTADGPDAA
ncbi:helix-turn-helix transcriptional regulator [Haematomicrobium sanguinis]|uniref:helix-turn-helix transcriptional regulator n=1 Tax=Haematomicrobium sanguinis TaxID=479106 RepID=UPI00047C8E8B|nr:helix-turn-helix domain-containing protein [Haematomicrobium sanguinis]